MPRIYGYVRPYPGRLGKQVRDFVEEQGFVLGPGMVVAAGATDIYASRWIMRATMDLLVLPFHLHRGDGGRVLDAIGVLLSLPEDVDLGGLTVLMPVRAFSWGSSFQRRLHVLKETRPHIAEQVLIAHQEEIGSLTLASRLRRAFAHPPSTAPLVRSPSVSPPTVRNIPVSPPPPAFPMMDFGLLDAESVRGRTVSGVQVRESNERDLPASEAESRVHVSSLQLRVSGRDGTSGSDGTSGRDGTSGSDGFRLDGVSGLDKMPPSGAPQSTEGLRGGDELLRQSEERSSLILPKRRAADSAEDVFRRAAEIGAKTRQDGSGRKKGS